MHKSYLKMEEPMYYILGKELTRIPCLTESIKNSKSSILAVFTKDGWMADMDEIGFEYDWDLGYSAINCSKMEYQKGYLAGSFCIPKLFNQEGERRELMFFMNKKYLVFVDHAHCAEQIIEGIRQGKTPHAETAEQFLYHFISRLLYNGGSILENYEQELIGMEEKMLSGAVENVHKKLVNVRKDLLELECYYDQLSDVAKELKENELEFFSRENLRYFRILSDRAARMERRSEKLLAQSKQVRDVYQAQSDDRQNYIMQFLTVVSTVFAPLTLLTGWYGMNFENMPELKHGYPFVVTAAIVLVVLCIVYFKKKKML